MNKLKIDLKNGMIEVEGENDFVSQVYQDNKERLFSLAVESPVALSPKPISEVSSIRTKANGKASSKRKEVYQIVKDLNLSPKDDTSLKAFFTEKKPANGMLKNAVFVYYLQKIIKVENINVNHIYTCYKDVGESVPGALKQSLLDTASKKGWIDTKNTDSIIITTIGENEVELKLPAKSK